MPKKESPLHQLAVYLPENTYEDVMEYLHLYKVHLTVTRARSSVLGDYRNKSFQKNHRISVNGNLNKYAFLITLLHELGHLLAFEKYGNKIQAHGAEWKQEFGNILVVFIKKKIFPADVEWELICSLKNPAASSCAEEDLIRVLRKYDPHKPGFYFVEQLPANAMFKEGNGRVFVKGNKVRKRFVCKELPSGKLFLFSPVTEVELVTQG